MRTVVCDVTRRVVVTIDEEKLRPLMPEFNSYISDFGEDDSAFEMHAQYLAVLAACGIYEFQNDQFIEGYGPAAASGLSVKIDDEHQFVDLTRAEGDAA